MKRIITLLLLVLLSSPLFADITSEAGVEITTGPAFTHAFGDAYPLRSSLLSDVRLRGGINAGDFSISLLFAYSYNTKTLIADNIQYIDYSTARAGLQLGYEVLSKLELTLSTDFGFVFFHSSEMKAFILNSSIGIDYRVFKAFSLLLRLQAGYLNNAIALSAQAGVSLVLGEN